MTAAGITLRRINLSLRVYNKNMAGEVDRDNPLTIKRGPGEGQIDLPPVPDGVPGIIKDLAMLRFVHGSIKEDDRKFFRLTTGGDRPYKIENGQKIPNESDASAVHVVYHLLKGHNCLGDIT